MSRHHLPAELASYGRGLFRPEMVLDTLMWP